MPPTVRLLSLTTTAGLLKGCVFEPAPGVTCVIGDPGAGKSTVIETLRFCVNADPKWVNMLLGVEEPGYGREPLEFGHLKATLAGGTAICRLLVDYGNATEVLRVERHASDHAPRVYKDGTDEPGDASVLDSFEIYSQGDVLRIAKEERRRLALHDRRERSTLDALRKELDVAAAEVIEVDIEYATAGDLLETQEAQLTHLNERQQKLAFLRERRPPAPPELEAERARFDKRRHVIESLEYLESRRLKTLPSLSEVARDEVAYREALVALSEHPVPEAREIEGVYGPYATLLSSIGSTSDFQKTIEGRKLIEKLRARFEEQNRPYHKLNEQQKLVAEAQREEDQVRGEVQRLERIAAEKKRTEQRREELRARREGLRARVRQLKGEIFKLRQRIAEETNAHFRDMIRLKVHEDAYSPPEYKEALVELLRGSGFRNQQELAADLARTPPAELISAIEERDLKFLAAFLGRERSQMEDLVDHFVSKTDREIYGLEKFVFDDDLEISLKDEHGAWKAMGQLSKGTKALALLPIILMDGTAVLAGDQLEDAINNRLVMETLVTPSLSLKRQVILVTHNANIALLTKADRVVVVKYHGDNLARLITGTVTQEGTRHVLDLLEGGSDAFMRRMKLYGDLLNEAEPAKQNDRGGGPGGA